MKITKVLFCQLALIIITASAFAEGGSHTDKSSAESYSNFPTVTAEFKSTSECETWLSAKSAKYGARVLSTDCKDIVQSVYNGSHVPGSRVVGSKGIVILDTL